MPSQKLSWPPSTGSCCSVMQGQTAADIRTLSPEEAKDILEEALAALTQEAHLEQLKAATLECNAIEDPLAQHVAKMGKVLPMVRSMLLVALARHGITEEALMPIVLQLRTHAEGNAEMVQKVTRLMGFLEGQFA
eukprot:gb/GFBE01075068.1/.p1 GENE.gb/GFBE01075068.1/~~gb/GFBE01075068.1/.p1  ORF type:complete len:135 (+),score=42.60 gb/GFBE01075068.1/:1-405(+)